MPYYLLIPNETFESDYDCHQIISFEIQAKSSFVATLVPGPYVVGQRYS